MQAASVAFSILTVGLFLTLSSDLLGVPGHADARHPKCFLPPDPGIGDKRRNAWYYSMRDKKCYVFAYLGTWGNKNRFKSEKACLKECGQ